MASNSTPTYALNQWLAEDAVLREEFNADNAKIEAAILAARTAPGCVSGSYEGGANSSKVTVNLGFRPSFLVIIRGKAPIDSTSAMAIVGTGACRLSLRYNASIQLDSAAAITDSGFTVSGADDDRYGMNYSGTTYYYTAFY